MDNTNYDEKWNDSDELSEGEKSFEEEEQVEDYVFNCKNIDPKLAALMNIVIEEQNKFVSSGESWKPPSRSGLDNSEPIVKKKAESKEVVAFYEQLKDDITYFRKLSDKQLDYMKHSLTNDQKIEVIELYNVCQEYCRKK
jgi:hypothetical protein